MAFFIGHLLLDGTSCPSRFSTTRDPADKANLTTLTGGDRDHHPARKMDPIGTALIEMGHQPVAIRGESQLVPSNTSYSAKGRHFASLLGLEVDGIEVVGRLALFLLSYNDFVLSKATCRSFGDRAAPSILWSSKCTIA